MFKNCTVIGIFATFVPSLVKVHPEYSVLLEAADKANNSKIARRLVFYSPTSKISVNEKDDSKIFVSTVLRETGYMWQPAKVGTIIEITVEWANHFANKYIKDGNLLNKVKPFPIQFREIQKDKILLSLKFVTQGFDDDEGTRTKSATPNKHGIVRFEAVMSFSDGADLPIHGWFDINNLAEKFSFNVTLGGERTVRSWVRAHDILGNTIVDGTEVNFDATGPIVNNRSVYLLRNHVNGIYKYTSSWRSDSGMHKTGFTLTRDDTGEVKYAGFVAGSSKNMTGSCRSDLECICVRDTYILLDQTLDLDNCWFMTAKEELDHASVTVDVIVYNQALLSNHFSLKIDKLDTLKGLEEYSGPTNIHVTQNLQNSVRLAWDQRETDSCYGRTYIVIILYMHDGTTKHYIVSRTIKFVDFLGLISEYNYKVLFSLQYDNQPVGNIIFNFKTDTISMSLLTNILLGVAVILTCLMCGFFVYKSRKRLRNNISTASEVDLPDVDPGISNEFDLVHIDIDPVTNHWTIGADNTEGLRTVIDETGASGSPALGSGPCPIMQNEPSEILEETCLQTDEDAYLNPI